MSDHLFAVDQESRTLRGILLPFAELSRVSVSGAEPVQFNPDSINLPRDPSVVTLNRDHDRFNPIGRAVRIEKRDEGIYAEFQVADTDEGDAYLAESDAPRALSAEVADLVRKGAEAVSARLTGAAIVPEGAFAGAHLFAIGDVTHVTPDEQENAAEAAQEKEVETMTTIVPEGVGVTEVTERPTDSRALFAAIASGDADRLAAFRAAGNLFAIANVQDSGPSGATIGADTRQPQALGELWSGKGYNRRYADLVNHQDLTSTRAYGWRWVTKPTVGDYSGNAAEVPSSAVDTEPVTADAVRLAGGNRLDRRFYDFNDQGVVESFMRLQAEDYARKSDAKALAALVGGATAMDIGAAVSGVDDSLVGLVDGALAVVESENTPSFAVVDPDLYRRILTTPKDKVFEFLNAGFGLEEGSAIGFRIIPGNVGTGKILVGAKEAATIFELAGSPIRVEGLAVTNGAVDVAVFGYFASIINNPAALALVDTARA